MVGIAFGISTLVSMTRLSTGVELPEMHSTAFLVLLPYALVRWGWWRDVAIGSAVVASAAAAGFLANNAQAGDVIGGTAVLLAAMAIGAAVRYRARALSQEIKEAKLREREQIARDLHDSVAHHVSAIAIRAQSGLATVGNRDTAFEALHDIEAEASRALTEMRRMVHVLRQDRPAELTPTPGIKDIEHLAGSSADGPNVDVTITGDLGDLSAAISSAVYRVAQEAITNARRHAVNASQVAVAIALDEASVRLSVCDDGAPSSSPAELLRPGYGLVGMAERAQVLGGTFQAGPGPEKGWHVTVVLPRHAPGT